MTGKTQPKKKVSQGSKYSKKDVMQLKSIFVEYDKDGSETISVGELLESLKKSDKGALATAGHDAFKALDKNGDGRVTFSEYLSVLYPLASEKERKVMCNWAYPHKEAAPPTEPTLSREALDELRAVFSVYDKDRSGFLDHKEFITAASTCGYESDELEDLLRQADGDGNGKLTFDEFVDILKSSYI